MLHKLRILAVASLTLCVMAGCAPKHVPSHSVVLVSDPDGHVGKAEVATQNGKQLLVKQNDMTRVSSPTAPPTPVTTATPDYIAVTFLDALAIAPTPSEKFILFFESGKFKLTEEAQNTIPAMLEAIKRRGALTITISGHADAAGSVSINDKLAYERGTLVQELLLKNGVDPKRLTTSSHGKSNPLVPTPDGVAEPRNRRVEVVIR